MRWQEDAARAIEPAGAAPSGAASGVGWGGNFTLNALILSEVED